MGTGDVPVCELARGADIHNGEFHGFRDKISCFKCFVHLTKLRFAGLE